MPATQAIWLISGLPGPGFRPWGDSHVPGPAVVQGPRTRPRMGRRRPGVKSRRTAPASPPCLDELGVEERTSRRARALHSHIGSMAHYPPEERHRSRPHSTAGLDPYTRRVGARSTAPRIQGEMTASQLPSAAGPRCHDAGTQAQMPGAVSLCVADIRRGRDAERRHRGPPGLPPPPFDHRPRPILCGGLVEHSAPGLGDSQTARDCRELI